MIGNYSKNVANPNARGGVWESVGGKSINESLSELINSYSFNMFQIIVKFKTDHAIIENPLNSPSANPSTNFQHKTQPQGNGMNILLLSALLLLL